MQIEVKPATVVIDGKTVAFYSTHSEACAFRNGVEWAEKKSPNAEKIAEAIIHDLTGRSAFDGLWSGLAPDIRDRIRLRWIELIKENA